MKTLTILPIIAVLAISLHFGASVLVDGYYIPTTYDNPTLLVPEAGRDALCTPHGCQSCAWPYYDQSHAWMLFNEQSSQTSSWLGYPQTPSQGLYAMALDAQRRGAFAYADVLRRMTTVQFENEHRVAGIEASARAHAQIGEMVSSKQEKIRLAYAELQPMYDQLMHRRRDLKGQEDIHQYNVDAAQYTARLRQLRRDEAEVGMMMRSGPRY